MGKLPYLYATTDSDDTEKSTSSVEKFKKNKVPSILKYTTGNVKKKKCKYHSKSEAEESDRSRSSQRVQSLDRPRGILKHHKKNPRYFNNSSDEDEDLEPIPTPDKYLVGRVPAGSKPGRGGGVALIIRKNMTAGTLPIEQSSTNTSKQKKSKKLWRKKSY